jgi:arginine exporter protein ArgO
MLFEKKAVLKSVAIICLKRYAILHATVGCTENVRQNITRQNQAKIDNTLFFCIEIPSINPKMDVFMCASS